MNKEAVALAADSAVSLMVGPGDRPQKIFTSANKIFELERQHAVCLMIYNNASFMGIPWTTVIGMYRKSLGGTTFNSLDQYAEHFIAFLRGAEELIPSSVEEAYFTSNVYNHFLFLRYLIQQNATALMREKGAIAEEEIQGITENVIGTTYNNLTSAPYSPAMDETVAAYLSAKYQEVVSKAIAEVFQNLPIPDATVAYLREIAALFFVKSLGILDPLWQNFSGVVVMGFGENDIFPSLRSFMIEGKIDNHLKYTETERQQVTFENGAIIVPFAQREMVDIFMSGMDPRFEQAIITNVATSIQAYPQFIINSIEKLDQNEKTALIEQFSQVSAEMVAQLQAQLQNLRILNFTPIINVVTTLPTSDMASLAESLVNLTTLKRRVSLDAETVGGPVDVAVISKGDGFTWIKKKNIGDITPQGCLRSCVPE